MAYRHPTGPTRGVDGVQVGAPPSTGEQILTWMASGKLALALGNEALFVAAMLLVPGIIAVHASLAGTNGSAAAAGAGLFATALPILFFVAIVHGRLAYQVYGIQVDDPAVAKLIVADSYGGLHAAGIILAVATLVLSLAMRDGAYGPRIANLGFATCAFAFIGSYPWVIGAALAAASQVVFAWWLIAVGWRLYTPVRAVPRMGT
jgi:hypothetical protein